MILTKADMEARAKAHAATKRFAKYLRRRGGGLDPAGALGVTAVLDVQIVALIDLIGGMLPGGKAQVWDHIAKCVNETVDDAESRRIQVAAELPNG